MQRLILIFSALFLVSLQANAGGLQVAVKALLQGAYNGSGQMSTALNMNPNPILKAEFQNATALPGSAVDKVTIELRRSTAPFAVVATQSAWLLSDGSIVDFATGQKNHVVFENAVAGAYYVMVSHRNHLPVISAKPIEIKAEQLNSVDLTKADNVSKTSGYFAAPNGLALMSAGNIYSSAKDAYEINAIDVSAVYEAKAKNATGYLAADVNLDGLVDDRDVRLVNTSNAQLYSFSLPLN